MDKCQIDLRVLNHRILAGSATYVLVWPSKQEFCPAGSFDASGVLVANGTRLRMKSLESMTK